jgi:glycosyltransferase involved in cell wall biosynthesis
LRFPKSQGFGRDAILRDSRRTAGFLEELNFPPVLDKVNMKPYLLITPARDEEAYIEKTIHSVVSQTVRPIKWVIVSDNSVDRTDEIVKEYADRYDFILFLRRSATNLRNYGSKALAIQFGYEQIKDLPFDFIGNLDADVSFEPTYYESILQKFEENPTLGLAGGVRYDRQGNDFHPLICARNSVGGPFQLFRRACYDAIGGYRPLRFGGIDTVAETMVRMHGWKVESFPEYKVYHYRPTGTAGGGLIRARYKMGVIAYTTGYHPLFYLSRCALRMFSPPPVIGSITMLAGYISAAIRYDILVPDDFVRFIRAEQMARLWSLFNRRKSVNAKTA